MDSRYLFDRLEQQVKVTGYRLRQRGHAIDVEAIYNDAVEIIRAINRFLEAPSNDLDPMLDAIVDLNVRLRFFHYHVTRSRRFRERLSNHIGWTLELAEARAPTSAERAVLDRLLTAGFRGRDQIRHQLQKYLVKAADENGWLYLYPDQPGKISVDSPVPVWAEAKDADGSTIYVRLHVVQGWIKELEVSRDDGSRISSQPQADDLTVHVS